MKKQKKLLFLGTISAVVMPIAAFSLVSQSFDDLPKEEDEDEEQGTDISQNGGINGIGVDLNSGDDHGSVQTQITEQNSKLTITLTGNGTIDKNLFNKLLKQRFYRTNSEGAIEVDSNQETRYFPVEKIILTDDVKLPDDSSDLFNFYTSYDEGTEELQDSDDLSEYKNQPKPKVVIENININTSNVTNMSNMFKNTDLDGIDFSQYPNWDVSNVINLSGMFSSTTHANLDLTHWNINSQILEGGEEQEENVKEMFVNTNGSVTINGEVAKKLFNKVPQDHLDVLMSMDSDDDSTVYGIFDSSGKLLGYHSESGDPDEELISMLEDGVDYTFKLVEKNPTAQIDKYKFLNSKQKEPLQQSITDKESDSDEAKDYNEVIKDAYNLDNKMEELTEENESKLKTYIQDREKYTDEFNKEVEQLSKKVNEALENLNTTIKNKDGINDLIEQIENLRPDENIKTENSGTSDSETDTDSSPATPSDTEPATPETSPTDSETSSDTETSATPETTPIDSNTHNESSESDSQTIVPIVNEAEDTAKEIENLLAEYKNASANGIDLLENLNRAQKDALKEEINSKNSPSEVNEIIKKADKLNKTMQKLTSVLNNELNEFVNKKDNLDNDLKSTVKRLNDQITKIINTSNSDSEVNKNTAEVETLINEVKNLLSNFKQDAKDKIDALDYLNKAQKEALKEDVDSYDNTFDIDKIASKANKLNDKMSELNNLAKDILNEFIKHSNNISEEFQNELKTLNDQVRSVINTQNTEKSVDKDKYEVQELINQISALLNNYKSNLKHSIDETKNFKYLNRAQKANLKNQIEETNSVKELNNILTYTTQLDNKMKQLSVATNTDLQDIIDSNNKETNTKALNLKNEIYPYLQLNTCSLDNNLSPKEIDEYITKINNLKGIENNQSVSIADGIIKTKKMHSGFILMNIFATTLALIVTAVIIKRYKNKK